MADRRLDHAHDIFAESVLLLAQQNPDLAARALARGLRREPDAVILAALKTIMDELHAAGRIDVLRGETNSAPPVAEGPARRGRRSSPPAPAAGPKLSMIGGA